MAFSRFVTRKLDMLAERDLRGSNRAMYKGTCSGLTWPYGGTVPGVLGVAALAAGELSDILHEAWPTPSERGQGAHRWMLGQQAAV
eukprot:CAMPEP_0115842778 /NCGR_PEP_ID=MMETSP0287-20121206/7973_1 /TAXON_ID=412157 /ORGANISM="Chrysochromulina rotalis, Strain UIO044" /LENGTH=85 /DNA_ID=CAMNT_0003296453 /DNA_START=704 /DNA_END=962 /DNA_ORIENTATION=+